MSGQTRGVLVSSLFHIPLVTESGTMSIRYTTTLSANTTQTVKLEARKLARRHILDGDRGSIQDLVNFVFSALAHEPELCDALYERGRYAFEELHAPPSKRKKPARPVELVSVSFVTA